MTVQVSTGMCHKLATESDSTNGVNNLDYTDRALMNEASEVHSTR